MWKVLMTDDQLDLARRLVEAPWWEWLPGMKSDGWTHITADDLDCDLVPRRSVPDLTDPATGGVLLGMLPNGRQPDGSLLQREAAEVEDGWVVRVFRFQCHGELPEVLSEAAEMGTTLAEAAAKALLALKE